METSQKPNNVLGQVRKNVHGITVGYTVISFLMLGIHGIFREMPGVAVWTTAMVLMPVAFLSVELVVRKIFKMAEDREKSRSHLFRRIPYILTFILYFYNFFIFLVGVSSEESGAIEILEALMLAMLVGAYLFFGFEHSLEPVAEAGLLPGVRKPFPPFELKIAVTFFVFSIFPLLFILLKIIYYSQGGDGESVQLSPVSQIGPTLLRVGIILPPAGFFLTRTILKPVRRLTEEMERVEEGDLTGFVPAYSTDETGLMSTGFNRMARSLEEKEKIRKALGVYVSPEVAGKILTDELKPGGERTIATVLFTDLRGFTTLSEHRDPQEIVSLLNDYFERMVGAIEKEGGFVNKFIGDAILAVFGAPVSCEKPELSAIRAATGMLEALETMNQKNREAGLPELKMGIGIHRGELLLGNIGSPSRMEYTVMGDTVNTASRIESATKKIGSEILVSEAVYQQTREEGPVWGGSWNVKLKGKNDPIVLFSVRSSGAD